MITWSKWTVDLYGYARYEPKRKLVSTNKKYITILETRDGRYLLCNSYSRREEPAKLLGMFPTEDDAKFAAELIRG